MPLEQMEAEMEAAWAAQPPSASPRRSSARSAKSHISVMAEPVAMEAEEGDGEEEMEEEAAAAPAVPTPGSVIVHTNGSVALVGSDYYDDEEEEEEQVCRLPQLKARPHRPERSLFSSHRTHPPPLLVLAGRGPPGLPPLLHALGHRRRDAHPRHLCRQGLARAAGLARRRRRRVAPRVGRLDRLVAPRLAPRRCAHALRGGRQAGQDARARRRARALALRGRQGGVGDAALGTGCARPSPCISRVSSRRAFSTAVSLSAALAPRVRRPAADAAGGGGAALVAHARHLHGPHAALAGRAGEQPRPPRPRSGCPLTLCGTRRHAPHSSGTRRAHRCAVRRLRWRRRRRRRRRSS